LGRGDEGRLGEGVAGLEPEGPQAGTAGHEAQEALHVQQEGNGGGSKENSGDGKQDREGKENSGDREESCRGAVRGQEALRVTKRVGGQPAPLVTRL
jgi:hypothetical protein